MEGKIGYRPEVDGLRAIAVMSVLLFHAGLPFVPAGFLGVDVFFVISGYLITNILHSDLEAGRFSIWRFYERRIRRIAPALLFVILLSVPAAYLLMVPDDLKSFGQSIIATILFSNNVLLWLSTNYFELSIEFKPLMHTWSLGVEEHYYIVVPLLMWGLHRVGRHRATWIGLALVTAASFALCLWAVDAYPRANFYLITSRAWELGAGSLIALGAPPRHRRLRLRPATISGLSALGLAMIVAPMLLLSRSTPLPGALTLVPVTGTCLVLLFANTSNPTGRLLSTWPFVGVGLISYSAYLFHQPIFAFTRIYCLEEPARWLMVALIPVTLVCAYASWRWVEQPFRQKTMPVRPMLALVASASAIALAAGTAFYLTAGFYYKWPELARRDTGFSARQNMIYNTGPDRFEGAMLPAPGTRLNVLVLGNSFGRDFINMGIEARALSNSNVSFHHMQACAPGALPDSIEANARRADFVVLAFDFRTPDISCIQARIRALRPLSPAKLIVFGTKSFGWNDNAVMRLPPAARYSYRPKPVTEIVEANAAAARTFAADVYVDVLGMISDPQGRVPAFTPDRYFISPDRLHFTRAGAAYIGAIAFHRHPALRALAARNDAVARPHEQPK